MLILLLQFSFHFPPYFHSPHRMFLHSKPLRIREHNIPLLVHGQGVFLFKSTKLEPCAFIIVDADHKPCLEIEFNLENIYVINSQTSEPYLDKKTTSGLSPLHGAYYWFSIDSQNQRFVAGVGEVRLETAIYRYQFPLKGNKKWLESFTAIMIPEDHSHLIPLRMLKDPVTLKVPLLVKDINQLTMDDIAKGNIMPSANLNAISQKLYHCIAGEQFVLDDDFPEFSKAIEYSIATPGLWCHKRLKEKETEFNKENPDKMETYLRITLGQNNGESPGIPYVMEIWPSGHYSPVHNHAYSSAVIRVLHGSIHVKLFPFLCDSPSSVPEFGSADFKKGDITWLTETLNSVHQLENRDTMTCITIQCYMYPENDILHYDYFDYLDGQKIQQYEPDSDMDFVAFKKLMKEEWDKRPQIKPLFSCFSF
jgi:hypothetical protein